MLPLEIQRNIESTMTGESWTPCGFKSNDRLDGKMRTILSLAYFQNVCVSFLKKKKLYVYVFRVF